MVRHKSQIHSLSPPTTTTTRLQHPSPELSQLKWSSTTKGCPSLAKGPGESPRGTFGPTVRGKVPVPIVTVLSEISCLLGRWFHECLLYNNLLN